MNNHLVKNSLIVTDLGLVPSKRDGQLYRKMLVYASLSEIRKIFSVWNMPNPLVVGALIQVIPKSGGVVEFYYNNNHEGYVASNMILFGKSLCDIKITNGLSSSARITGLTYLAHLGGLSVNEATMVCLELTFL